MSMCTAASNLPILILMTSDEPLNQASDDSVQAPSTRAGHRWALPAIGALATAAAYITAFLLTAGVSWLTSVCNEDPSVVASKQHALRTELLLVWLVASAVPLVVAGLARRMGRRIWPWLLLSGPPLVAALTLGTTAQPTTWCLY
jgi:hypothetical protein